MTPYMTLAVVALASAVASIDRSGPSNTTDFEASHDNMTVETEYFVSFPAPAPKMSPVFRNANASATTTENTTSTTTESTLLWIVAALVTFAAGAAALVTATVGKDAVVLVCRTTFEYWRCLVYYWRAEGSYAECPYFADSLQARVHVRSLALINEIWHDPHYRNGCFGDDMRKNLRNVAVPGTGLPLSTLCFSATFFRLVLVLVYPLVCLAAAIVNRKSGASFCDVATTYKQHLLTPTDWFSLWRLNCRLASYHALRTKDEGFKAEDKWTFITNALETGIPVSPIMEIPSIVCKDRNEEGGMGIHFFRNALKGGDWIIQKVLSNSTLLQTMLPENAPLSTIRIVTASRQSYDTESSDSIEALSGVFRAGRAGALTDHDAILFDLDLNTGVIGEGTINKQWYQLGLGNIGSSDKKAVKHFSKHPDCGAPVTGRVIPDIEGIKKIVIDAHMKSCPNVPLCGWDVALTTDETTPTCLLEVNLSCNFFQGTVDYPNYFKFVDSQFRHLEAVA